MTDSTTIYDELEAIRKQGRGLLRPEDVVEFARDPATAMHTRFEWEDSKAASEYRLWQARELIRVAVRVLPNQQAKIKAYVSLTADRNAGGGYRAIVDVMKDDGLRDAMLEEALAELKVFKAKYRMLKALVPLFEELDRLAKKRRR